MVKWQVIVTVLALSVSFLIGCEGNSSSTDTLEEPGQELEKDSGILAYERILNSYTTRAFTEQEVEDEKIQEILQSGHRAPSARNTQPAHFTVVKDFKLLQQINENVVEGVVAILVSAAEPEEGVYPAGSQMNLAFDLGLVTQNMYLTAQSLELGAHIVAAPLEKINGEMLDDLEIPEGNSVASVLWVGYAADIEDAVSNASVREDVNDSVNIIGEIVVDNTDLDNAPDLIELIQGSYRTHNSSMAVQPVDTELINLILAGGNQAPSARNTQPWHFTVVTDHSMIEQFNENAVEGVVAIVVSAAEEEADIYPANTPMNLAFDLGLATQNMYLMGQALGLGSHIVAAPLSTINTSLLSPLEIPEGNEAVAVLYVGHIADLADATSNATEREILEDSVNFID